MTDEKDHEKKGEPIVEVTYLKTNKEVRFHVEWTNTLQFVWDKAYDELHEKKVADDKFECSDGNLLTAYLDDTLEQLREKKICVDRKYQIHGPTGGA